MSKQKYPQNKADGAALPGRRLRTEGYSNATLHAKRDRKRSEAEARQRSYKALTRDEKLALCEDRRGKSAREVARLQIAG
jgi:hypothetical protein